MPGIPATVSPRFWLRRLHAAEALSRPLRARTVNDVAERSLVCAGGEHALHPCALVSPSRHV
jgi:hypothetical protein